MLALSYSWLQSILLSSPLKFLTFKSHLNYHCPALCYHESVPGSSLLLLSNFSPWVTITLSTNISFLVIDNPVHISR